MRLIVVAIRTETDVVFARQRARHVAERLGFDKQDQTRISTAVSEIARNALEHGGGGRMEVAIEGARTAQSLVIRVVDEGPGIADLKGVMNGDVRSEVGLGVGLIGSQRLVDGLEIESAPGAGTKVTLLKSLRRGAAAISPAAIHEIAGELARDQGANPLLEVRQQNQELLYSLAEQRRAEDALRRLNDTLEDRIVERTTELRESQEELFQARKIEVLGQMTGAVAHDFNNVLLVVLANLELLRSLAAAEPDQLRLIDAAERGALRGRRMVSDLLTFARKQPLTPKSIDVGALLAAFEEPLRQMLPPSAALRMRIGERVPRVSVDQAQFERALTNLVTNARDALEGGAGTVTVETDGIGRGNGAEADLVRLVVHDTGVGMSPDVRQRVFEPFFTTKPAGSGTGLGLSQVYGFVRQSKGEIEIASTEGEGTTVTILLAAER